MGRFMLGVLTMFLVMAAAVGVLIVLDKVGMIALKPTTISLLGKLPGWGDLPQSLAVGREQREDWQDKEKTYKARVATLKGENNSLKKELEKAQRALIEDPKKKPAPVIPAQSVTAAASVTNKGAKLPDSLGTVKHAARLLGEMKPQPAADILMKIEPEVALEILDKVETRKAAKIIEAMPVEKGSALVAKLAEKK